MSGKKSSSRKRAKTGAGPTPIADENCALRYTIRNPDGSYFADGTISVQSQLSQSVRALKMDVIRDSGLYLFPDNLRADGPYDDYTSYHTRNKRNDDGHPPRKREGFEAPDRDDRLLSTCGIRAGDVMVFHLVRFRNEAVYYEHDLPQFEYPAQCSDSENESDDELPERFESCREHMEGTEEYLDGEFEAASLEGTYDVIFASFEGVDVYETPLKPIIDGVLELGTDGQGKQKQVKGTFTADTSKLGYEKLSECRYKDVTQKLGPVQFSFDETFPYKKPMFRTEKYFYYDFEEKGVLPANIVFPKGHNGRLVHLKSVPAGLKGEIDSDAATNAHHGFLYVYSKDRYIKRQERGGRYSVDRDFYRPSGKVEDAVRAYDSAARNSWIHRHFNLPDLAANRIFDYWRTEPPPALVFREGDVLLVCGWGDHMPMAFICRRSRPQEGR